MAAARGGHPSVALKVTAALDREDEQYRLPFLREGEIVQMTSYEQEERSRLTRKALLSFFSLTGLVAHSALCWETSRSR